jgi:hypothetical protein
VLPPFLLDPAAAAFLFFHLFFAQNPNISLNRESTALFANGVVFAKLLNTFAAEEAAKTPGTQAVPLEVKDSVKQMSKLYNWNVLVPALAKYNIHLDSDTKALIVAGDLDVAVTIMKELKTRLGAKAQKIRAKKPKGGPPPGEGNPRRPNVPSSNNAKGKGGGSKNSRQGNPRHKSKNNRKASKLDPETADPASQMNGPASQMNGPAYNGPQDLQLQPQQPPPAHLVELPIEATMAGDVQAVLNNPSANCSAATTLNQFLLYSISQHFRIQVPHLPPLPPPHTRTIFILSPPPNIRT